MQGTLNSFVKRSADDGDDASSPSNKRQRSKGKAKDEDANSTAADGLSKDEAALIEFKRQQALARRTKKAASPAAGRVHPAAAFYNTLEDHVPAAWAPLLTSLFASASFNGLKQFLVGQAGRHIFPPQEDIFNALVMPPADVRVVILGQDPYHGDGQAHGLAFSVRKGIAVPPSLRNMYKELEGDIEGFKIPKHGYLQKWADQGVLMLNTALTVQAHQANSHSGKGWEDFTNKIISIVNDQPEPVVFLLWGGPAKKKAGLVTKPYHHVLTAAHPRQSGREPVDWQI